MERQRRAVQEAQAQAVLAAALTCLAHRAGPAVCRDLPLTPGTWARPSLKAMQAALYLLYHRIRGAARAKKELQHVYPVLEPAQAREFKTAMHEWVRELGAAGAVAPDTVKYFVSAFQGSAAHRAVLMLLDLSALVLAKELGGPAGPLACLPDADVLQPSHGGGGGVAPLPPRRSAHAAAAAQRQLQARLDAVVAAMQRLNQLVAQASGALAAEQAASGGAAAALALRVPLLFTGSQAATRRGELVQELLLAHGPPLTAQPEAVGPGSWADLLAAGKGLAAAGTPTAPAAAVAARRLSNPAQEASNFAAEGLAADADVLTVHSVLVQRLAASSTALRAAACACATPGSAEVQSALAEAATYRESLMLSIQQELVAAAVRAEQQQQQQAAASISRGPAMLQLLPRSLPPRNPVSEGMQAAQQAAAAANAAGAASSSCSWVPPEPAAVEALRRSMWQRLHGRAGSSSEPADGSGTGEGAAPAAAAASPVAASPLPESPPLQGGGAVHAASSSSSKPPRTRPPATALDSPSLEAMISHSSRGLVTLSLLADLPGDVPGSPLQQQQESWQPSRRQQPGSPCMAASCASAPVMGENGSSTAAVAASRQRPLALSSPMHSAAASFMPPPQQQQRRFELQPHHHQPSCSYSPPLPTAVPAGALSPPLRLLDGLSPAAGNPALQQFGSSGSLDTGSPAAPTRSWRHAVATAGAAAPPAPGSSGNSRRRAASFTFTLTPPRRFGSPEPERQQQQPSGLGSPSPLRAASLGCDGGATPVSRLYGGEAASSLQFASTSASSPVLQTLQQQLLRQASGDSGGGSPGSQLLASCFKSKPAALAPSPFALAAALQPLEATGSPQEQPLSPQWTIAAARSADSGGGGALGSPAGSGGRRRSRVITTSSPLAPARSLHATPRPPSRAAAEAAAVAAPSPTLDELLDGPKRFDSPAVSSLSLHSKAEGGGGHAGTSAASANLSDLMQRFSRLKH